MNWPLFWAIVGSLWTAGCLGTMIAAFWRDDLRNAATANGEVVAAMVLLGFFIWPWLFRWMWKRGGRAFGN
jgi:hypothetical protein